jgi:hypothetical protein
MIFLRVLRAFVVRYLVRVTRDFRGDWAYRSLNARRRREDDISGVGTRQALDRTTATSRARPDYWPTRFWPNPL